MNLTHHLKVTVTLAKTLVASVTKTPCPGKCAVLQSRCTHTSGCSFKFKTTSHSEQGTSTEPTSPPLFPTEDWIGPVDQKSNLHRIQFAHPEDETKTEENYRLLREATHTWNQQFWSKQNEKFVKAKQQFTHDMFAFRGQSKTNDDGTKRVLTAEELAEFYTEFLEQNRDIYKTYNREWYRRNLYMLWVATCATVVRFSKRFGFNRSEGL